MNDLAKSIESFLIEQKGCRFTPLYNRFFQGEDAVDGDTFWAAFNTIPNVMEDDVGDDDCPKPYYYIPVCDQ